MEKSQATAMAQIAVAAGVPASSITAETRSRDTIGNIWFTKPLLGDPWRVSRHRGDLGLACGSRPVPDASDLGTSYQVALEPVTSETSTRSPEEIARWQAGLLAVSQHWFAGIRPGDDAAIAAALARDHPVYADHPQTTLAELAAMIIGHSSDHG